MCFNKEMSGSFAVAGFFMSFWVWHKTSNTQLAIGIFYFFLMEFLQFFQYLTIDQCDNTTNQFLTVLGYLHICYQPYFTHVINSSLTKSKVILWQYVPIMRLCIIGGTLLALRLPFSHLAKMDISPDGPCGESTEWLRGEKLCTISGKYHLAWSVPMSDPSYLWPSAAIHSFLMFAPFFVLKWNMIIQGLFLFATGPLLAAYITPNLQEQASIWCFFSISQIGIMLYLIRDVLIVHWGRASARKDAGIAESRTDATAPFLHLRYFWPMGVIEPKVTANGKNK
eukprot:m.480702 g.480702  ORF g.480702 m.480702 type:complete len:282 (-) comp21928_c0_seq1:242-1087(-)